MTKKQSVKKSEALVKHWAPLFGFGHYKCSVTSISPDEKYWGQSYFDHHEEYFDVRVVPDGTLSEGEHAHLVLHELAHGILSLAEDSPAGCEIACNRIAKLLLGPGAHGPNYGKYGGPDRGWGDDDEEVIDRMIAASGTRKAWSDDKDQTIVRILDSLPDLSDREKYVLGALYVQGMSFREVARKLGVSARTVTRIRNQLVKRLAKVA